MKKTTMVFILACFGIALYAQQPITTEQLIKSEKDRFENLRNYDSYSAASNNFDVHFYRCQWTVNPAIRFISGCVASYFTITAATNNITFDLSNALSVDSVIYHGTKINYVHSNNSLQVNFPSTINVNQKDSVSIFYKGVPATGGGYFVTSFHSGTPVLWTLSEAYGARVWWPCKDVLTDKADSIDIIITNPSAYSSSSNGLPVAESISGSDRITHWKHRYPIAAYLVAIAVTNYSVVPDVVQLSRNMPVVLYAYPESVNTFLPATNTAKFCLQNFAPLITEYPFVKERYAQTQFGVSGGMEHQTNTFFGSPVGFLVAHELAHQWFGDKTTCGSWSDIWLNEGFASYMEYVYIELSNPSSKLFQLQSWRLSITSFPDGSVFVADTSNENRLFDGRLSYRKGAYLLHMLRGKLGDSIFFRGVRRYISDPLVAYKTARTKDLQRNLEEESGQDLDEFFNDWFYGEGYPDYEVQWAQLPSNVVRLQLFQTTSHPSVKFYEMPVPLQFKNATRDTIITVDHTLNGQLFTVNPGFAVDTVIIDPQLWVLAKNKISRKLSTVKGSNQIMIYPNPAEDRVTISLPEPITNGNIQVLNSIGQVVYSSLLNPSIVQIDVNTSAWSSGVYFLNITGKDFRQVKRIVILNR